MYKLQTSFFAGDSTITEDTGNTFNALDEIVAYLEANKPPSEHEWRVDDKGSAIAWTRYGGVEINYWKNGKIVTINDGGIYGAAK